MTWTELGYSIIYPFFRALGLIAMLPLGSRGVVVAHRIIFAAGLALLAVPVVPVQADWSYWGATSEFLVGAALGLPAALVVSAAGMFGEMFDSARGQSIGQLYDPLTEFQESAMAVLGRSAAWALLLFLGVSELLIGGYFRSFKEVQLGVLDSQHLVVFSARVMTFLTEYLSQLFVLIFPIAVLFLMLELGIAFISKMLPQMSFTNESFLVKTCTGFVFLLTLWRLQVGPALLNLAHPLFINVAGSAG